MITIYTLTIKSKQYPNQLRNIEDPPKILYAMGNLELLKMPSIAVVGSRCNTSYGEYHTRKFVEVLVQHNICIISGMALGIDSISHRTAIENGGKTIAVLGSGFSHIYPAENKQLFDDILKSDGLILTEYKNHVLPCSENFPKRNRIVSGLAKSVLVIEAIHRSGTTITAGIATQQGKKVYCIPRNLEEKSGVGTNRLIQKGAFLVVHPNEILIDFGISEENEISIQEETPEENKISIPKEIPEEYQKYYQILEKEPSFIETLAKRLQEKISQINATLTLMEIDGFIQQLPDGRYTTK